MQLVVTLEMRFKETSDGKLWTSTMFPYSFWERYLQVFDRIKIIARAEPVIDIESDWKRVDGDMVKYLSLPYYIGPYQYLMQRNKILRILKQSVGSDDALLLRVPSNIANDLLTIFPNHPYGLEVVGDPYDVFAPGAVKHPLRFYFRHQFVHQLQVQCRQAEAVAYVTREALQQHYPSSPKAKATFYSSVDLPDNAFRLQPRYFESTPKPLRLCMVGTLEQLYKSPDILLQAFTIVKKRLPYDLSLTLVGDGKYRDELETLCKKLNIFEHVHFTGMLSGGDAVRQQLDQADLFVLPSRQEGLPRALIEAMARGLPCIGSTVGGIPELLANEDCVPPNDIQALADKIIEVCTDSTRLNMMAQRNWTTAHEYSNHILDQRRTEFYTYLRHITEEHIQRKHR